MINSEIDISVTDLAFILSRIDNLGGSAKGSSQDKTVRKDRCPLKQQFQTESDQEVLIFR